MISAKPLQDLIGIPHRLRALLELLGLAKQLWSHVLMGACPAPLSIKPVKGHCSLLAGAFTTTRILHSAAGTHPHRPPPKSAKPPSARRVRGNLRQHALEEPRRLCLAVAQRATQQHHLAASPSSPQRKFGLATCICQPSGRNDAVPSLQRLCAS